MSEAADLARQRKGAAANFEVAIAEVGRAFAAYDRVTMQLG